MKVCDEKITKLKERIKSELPIYSEEQINRSRDVTLECVLKVGNGATQRVQKGETHLFKSASKGDVLRKVFKDQTERAILKSKQISNLRMGEQRREEKASAVLKGGSGEKGGRGVPVKANLMGDSDGENGPPVYRVLSEKKNGESEKKVDWKNVKILPRNLTQESPEESTERFPCVRVLFN